MQDPSPPGDPVFAALGRLAAASGDGLALIDGAGHILHLSATACSFLGLVEAELQGCGFTLLFPAHERQDIETCLAAGMATSCRWSSVLPSPADAERAIEFTIVPHVVAGQTCGIVTVRDIAAYRQVAQRAAALAEEQLREKEGQYRSIFKATNDAMVISNAQGFCVEANPAACRMFGYSYEELIGLHAAAVTHPDYHHFLRTFPETVMAGGSIEAPAINLRKDGTPFHVVARATAFLYKGRPHILAVLRDITEQVRAEEQLRERDAQYRAIFEATTDGLLITDMEGRIVEANPAVCRLNGYSRDELLGRSVGDLVHPDFVPLIAQGLQAIAERGTFEARSVGLRKDGSAFFSESTATLFTYRGTPHVLGLVRDTTERVQAYELLEQRVTARTRELSALLDISHNVASTLELRPLLGLILAQLKTVVEYTGAAIWQLSADGKELVNLDYQGPLPREEILQLRFPLGHAGPDFTVVHDRRPVIVGDIGGKSRLAWAWEGATGRSPGDAFGYVRSWMGVPLVHKERMIGILVVVHQEPNHYTPRHADLALAVANQAAIAIENARLYERAQEVAVLEERQRLARELHDSVSQALYGIALGAQTARRLLDQDPARLGEPLDYVLELAEAALAEMRALIFELLPRGLETEGLVAALSKQAAAVQARHGIAVSTSLDSEPAAPLPAKEALYRIAQEALHNTVKHARARRIQMLLEGSADSLLLEIYDDGIGFDPGGAFPGHLGLQTMRDRAARAGGSLEIASAPGAGTRVRVQIPSPGHAAQSLTTS